MAKAPVPQPKAEDLIKKIKTPPTGGDTEPRRQAPIAVLPLRGLVIFPHSSMDLDVGRPKSVKSVSLAMEKDQRLFVVSQRNADTDEPGPKDLYDMGTVCRIKQVVQGPQRSIRVLVEGEKRARLDSFLPDEEAYWGLISTMPEAPEGEQHTVEAEAARRYLFETFEKYIAVSGRVGPEILGSLQKIQSLDTLCDVIAANILTKLEDRQEMLSGDKAIQRVERLCALLEVESHLAAAERMLQLKVKMQIEKNQRDYVLREQMRLIQEELGEQDDDIDDIIAKIKKSKMPEEAREKALKEAERMGRMSPGTPEISVIETYLDWLITLPWGKVTKDRLNLDRARKVLDKDHYGLKGVKERIIEFLAVMSMQEGASDKAALKGPILCFVGPPGVGKTSIARAVAEALGRQFVQVSLGGTRDEAEIFGHRRTYVGAIPGRIIAGMKRAKSMNPVFLFDEIDKMGKDFRGDPASAMLEVLDPEHNHQFRDHYLEVPFDLSQVLFITTANTRESIPAPLLDRMEVIEVPSYTEEEKLNIAKKHLVKKQVKENGLKRGSVKIQDAALVFAIEGYTREAGVRSLSRTIAKLVRKAAVEMLDTGDKTISITKTKARQYLGAERFLRDAPQREPMIGIVNGLAYTAVGGELLQIECAVMKGTGKLSLTGQLGDVMKESAQAALSWVRAHQAEYPGIPEGFSQTLDIHIHVPEGAVQKDGPSAGVTMTTALVSALANRPVRQDLAMTGEVTLTGRVLPIGGVKEKLLAAYRAKLGTIILPRENLKDLEEVPDYIVDSFSVHPVDTVDQVLKIALTEAR